MIPKRAVSPARSAASRANGAKSHGPVSPSGQATSARNSIRHGLRCRTLSLTADSPKFQTHYNCLLTNLIADAPEALNPESHHHLFLLQTLAWATAERDRVWALEDLALETEAARLIPANPNLTPAALQSLAFRSLCD